MINSRVFKIFTRLNEIAGTILGIIILVLVVYQFVSRASTLLSTPAWTTEAATFAFIWSCAVLAGSAYLRGAYVGIDLFSSRFSGATLVWYHRIVHLAVFIFAVALAYTGWNFGMKTLNQFTPALTWNRGYVNLSVCYLGVNLALSALALILSSDPGSHKKHAMAEA